MWRKRTGASARANPLVRCWLVLTSATVLISVTAPLAAGQSWTTAPDFEIVGPSDPGGDGGFDLVRRVRVSRDGLRVHVVEASARRITVWSPGGQLLLRLEGEDQLRALGRPWDVRLLPNGFWAMYDRHFARLSDDGAVLEVLEHSMWGVEAVLEDRGMLAYARLPSSAVMMGWREGEPPPKHQGVLHYSGTGGAWTADTVAVVDVQNTTLGVRFDDGSSPNPTATFRAQPFTDADLSYLDGNRGVVGVVQRNRAPGEVVVTEITVRGDTVWRRTLGLPPVPIPADLVEDTVQHLTRSAAATAQRLGHPITEATARQLAEEALHVPEYHAAVAEVRATTSGELWLRSPEVSDAPEVVWYAVPRGDDDAAPRRVLLPEWFQLRDATDTHVWGVRYDEEIAPRVMGRRLAP